jgi:uncharacterized caspase-like protein
MKQEISWLVNLAKIENGQAELILYYSGHGLADQNTKEPYLIPVDVSGSNVADGISLNYIYKQLNQYAAQRITVFIDACFSGGGRNQGLLAMKGVKIKPGDVQIDGKMVVFSSSTGEESSGVYREKQHGYFTYFLLKILQDTKGDVTYKKLGAYLTETISKQTALEGKLQNPQVLFSPEVVGQWENWNMK